MKNYDNNSEPHDDIDRVLDAALAEYTSVEPRAGLEDRILANLRDAEKRASQYGLWNWGFAVALAATIVMGVALIWRWNRPTNQPIAIHPPSTEMPVRSRTTDDDESAKSRKTFQRKAVRRVSQHEGVLVSPKLEVFPSPRPLSEQEQILAMYVNAYPERAALIAEARMESLRQDEAERVRVAAEGSRDVGH